MKKETALLKIALLIIALPALAALIFGFLGVGRDFTHGGAPMPRAFFFLAAIILSVLPYLYALRQGLTLLRNIDHSTAFSTSSLNALNRIRWCAIAISIVNIAGFIGLLTIAGQIDAPGLLAFDLLVIIVALIISVFASLLYKLFYSAMELEQENQLTI